ncbi:type III pantothenate kinase [Microbulbifer sp. YPW16]|uniref:type III pantothenate kinase n=1 Tax=unclassified Microbulbifer TaxID=2619833 RepID=UPI001E2CB824|nr:type III pantothenate kinase [Microbulbifer sp. YPW16]UHQ54474.1 type III pantothenate kinase [Microbulbifer sp. YPW16]
MILEIDIGNTRGKWRLVQSQSGHAVARGGFATGDLAQGRLPAQWAGAGPRRVRVANVAGARMAELLTAALRTDLSLEPQFARVERHCAGVTCGYRDTAALGVDRWLAVLAAHRRDPSPALVVDCGSAVTLDLLGTGGRHRGGYILPGLELMRRALYADTDAVKVAGQFIEGMSLAPGIDTAEAVNRGLPSMVLGAIERALAELRRSEEMEPLLWLTGGDGQFFASLFGDDAELVPDLVFEGLGISIP